MAAWKVQEWRNRTKQRLVDGFGGKCNKCGYDRCIQALEFHHLDPSEKKFAISSAMKCPKKWEVIFEEAQKCIMLCNICHVELHYNLWLLQDIELIRLDEDKKGVKKELPIGKCPVCDKDIFLDRITCSRACAAKNRNKIEWPTKEELAKLLSENSRLKVAAMLGVSDMAVKKRQIKYGLI